MMDLAKASHEYARQRFHERISNPPLSLSQRNYFLDRANGEELLGNYHLADNFRRLALGAWPAATRHGEKLQSTAALLASFTATSSFTERTANQLIRAWFVPSYPQECLVPISLGC